MYYAHAFRWGQTNNPSHHVVAAGPDLEQITTNQWLYERRQEAKK